MGIDFLLLWLIQWIISPSMILRLSTGFQIETAIATKDDILRAINKYYDIDEGFEELFGNRPDARGRK